MNDHTDSGNRLTHTDLSGKARMVDVSNKPIVQRIAMASGLIKMSAETIKAVRDNERVKYGSIVSKIESTARAINWDTHQAVSNILGGKYNNAA